LRFLRRYSAKVCTGVVASIALAILSAFPARAATPQTQEKPTEAAAQPAESPATTQPIDLSDEVVRDVLDRLQRGIETHDIDHVLDIFDRQNMKDFAQFQDQMVAFFRRYDSVRFRYQLLQVTSDKDGSYAIADIDMDADPSDILPTPQRRSTQMRFQMKRSPKGWKVVALKPADFFNQ
jgi:transposase